MEEDGHVSAGGRRGQAAGGHRVCRAAAGPPGGRLSGAGACASRLPSQPNEDAEPRRLRGDSGSWYVPMQAHAV